MHPDRRARRSLIVWGLIGLLAAGGVIDAPTPAAAQDGTATLESTDWRLTQLATDGALAPVTEGVTASGCNTFTGEYRLNGADRIAITGIVATRPACEDDVMATESTYLGALGRVDRWATRQDPDRGLILLLTKADDRLRLRYTIGITPF